MEEIALSAGLLIINGAFAGRFVVPGVLKTSLVSIRFVVVQTKC